MREPDADIAVAVAGASRLGESPMWHPREQVLYWCDIPGKPNCPASDGPDAGENVGFIVSRVRNRRARGTTPR